MWAEDDVLHVLWQGQADEVRLGGGVQPRLWPVAGTGDLWEASLRIRRLEQAVITVMAVPRLAGDDSLPRVPDVRVWRGPRAAAVARRDRRAPSGAPSRSYAARSRTVPSTAPRSARRGR